MSEVLSLFFRYDASTQRGSILARLDAVDEKGFVLLSVPQPEREFDLASLAKVDADQVSKFREFLAWLEPVARAKAEADATSPEKIREEANRIATERQALFDAQNAHLAGEKARQEQIAHSTAEIEKIDKALEAKSLAAAEELAAIEAHIAAKRAELASVETDAREEKSE